ncbi:MAG TPA: hypothetical protein VFC78_16575 [Tepidisphaeraceae bacterium]|nr:hypothetical protein [Tepidisphaeraceae bacterium]
MGKFWLKFWVTTKITIVTLLLLYILIFVWVNHSNQAKVWVWISDEIHTTTLMVAFFSFLAGVVGTILVRTTLKTLRQIRDLQARNRHEKMHRDLEDMKTKAAMLRPKGEEG